MAQFLPRVLHISPAAFGAENTFFGGGERYAVELAGAMAKKVPTTLLTFGAASACARDGQLTMRILRNWMNIRGLRSDPVNPLVVKALAKAEIVHVHQPYTMIAACCAFVCRIMRKPIFATDLGGLGLGFQRITNAFRFERNTGTRYWFTGDLHVSQFSRRLAGHEELCNARCIYGGVDPDRFHPDRSVALTNEVLVVSRLLPHKGINYVIDAIESDMRLRVIGRPFEHASDYRQLLIERADNKNVVFNEQCSDAELIRAYQGALCIVSASVYRSVFGTYHPNTELLGLSLLEGMACGRPVIGTNVASFPELIADGITGFLVPPNNPAAIREKIRWLMDHPVEADRMGHAAHQRVLRLFTWDAAVSKCLEAYIDLPKLISPRPLATLPRDR